MTKGGVPTPTRTAINSLGNLDWPLESPFSIISTHGTNNPRGVPVLPAPWKGTMASIFQGNRIREHKALKVLGKPLVYGIGTSDPSQHIKALQAHDFVYTLSLSDLQKQRLTPKWMGGVVKDLLLRPREAWKDILAAHLPRLDQPQAVLAWADPPVQALERQQVQASVPEVIRAYNYSHAHYHFGPYFPGHSSRPDLITAVIDLMLKNGSLMASKGSNIPMPEYGELLALVPKPQYQALRRKIAAVQDLVRFGKTWERFCIAKGLQFISQFEEEHAKAFLSWRRSIPCKGPRRSIITTHPLKKEIVFFQNVCQYAVKKRLVPFNSMEGVRLSRMETRISGGSHQNFPFSIDEMVVLLRRAKERVLDHKDPKKAVLAKLQYHTILFMVCTGCRPKETSEFSVHGEDIVFHKRGIQTDRTGKTKHAKRRIPITPTLRFVVDDGTIFRNENTWVAANLSRFIGRLGLKQSNPYRLRHTICTLLFCAGELSAAEIAYRLGHHSPDFSYRQYSEMDSLLGAGYTKQQLRSFWHWLNHEVTTTSFEP